MNHELFELYLDITKVNCNNLQNEYAGWVMSGEWEPTVSARKAFDDDYYEKGRLSTILDDHLQQKY